MNSTSTYSYRPCTRKSYRYRYYEYTVLFMNRLNSIHSQGYIHRDLKPANVVIGNESSEAHFIYLIDFGLAKKENSTNPVPETQGKGKVTSGGGTI